MGQRSQLYVRCQLDGKNYLTARYNGWNYGERMISRARYTIEWIKDHISHESYWYLTTETEKLKRILDTNFDMIDVIIGQDIVDEYYELKLYDDTSFNDCVFLWQDNNNGKLFIDIKDGVIKYAFTNSDCTEFWNAYEYIHNDIDGFENIDDEEARETCKKNIAAINEMATLMTIEELDDFINCKYENEDDSRKN